ncbi:hypothetical protein [Streptomyces sp. FIT100]|uniref:hypothetical protein n=1 Tax=Streptomyces sp. FIT100 TaxID=2837956 RepID=UPI0021C58ACB|nr:hypothetical protein [Streptomyces sp. FIT100]UUN30050.1 hypothetical protein KK483_29550 [Streptomyces sp. FIT100]
MNSPARRARYHLRFQLRPGDDLADRAGALARMCGENGVDEVVLLLGAEQLYTGHLAGPEETSWFAAAAEALAVLSDAGLDVSLNPWVTAGHADRGRAGTLGFAPMVSPTGRTAAAQASFACPRWRKWLYAHYGRFAELGFRVLWVEDDFRFHNHAPLDWGGGFEPLMLERLARLAGEPVTREQVVAAVTAPGPPHPWRTLLQQVWRTAQLEVAEELAEVVRERSGGRSQLGLMSSPPAAHSVEGRDWAALFTALSVRSRVVHRPHFAPYSDTPARGLTSAIWSLELQRALRPRHATCEPEIENWPHTSWSKSDTQTWSEMVTAQLSAADALLLNVHPTHAEHAGRFPRIDRLLRRSRPALDWLAERGQERPVPLGVGLPWRQDTASRLTTVTGRLEELEADPGAAADFLLGYGVPVTAQPAPVQALFGRIADTFSDDELHDMLRGGLLLDGVAAAVLTRRGLAGLLGVRAGEPVSRDEHAPPGPYAVERVVTDVPAGEGTLLSVDVQPALARLEPLDGAQVVTSIHTPDGRLWGTGRCHFVNSLGGRVAVLAATAPAELARSDEDRLLVHAAVRFLEGKNPRLPLVSGAPHLIPHASRSGEARRLAVVNGSADAARPRVHLPSGPELPSDHGTVRATLLAPLDEPVRSAVEPTGDVLELMDALPHRGWAVFEW